MTDLELVLSIIVFGVLMYFCPSLLSDERKTTLDEFMQKTANAPRSASLAGG